MGPTDAAQAPTGEFRSYALGNVRARDIAPTLTGLLPPETPIVVDDQLNRILVSGPPRLQSHVQGAITSLDQVRIARAPDPPVAAPAPELKAYRLAPDQASRLAAKLEEEFGRLPGVRMAFDSRMSQILVTAPADVQVQIAERVSAAAPAAAAARPNAAPIEAGGMLGAREFQLQQISGEELNARLVRMLGSRLSTMQSSSADVVAYQLPLAGSPGLVVAVDLRAQRARIEGPSRAVDSCMRMIQALDSAPLAPHQGMSLVSLRAAQMDDIRKTARAVAQNGSPAVLSGANNSSLDNRMLVARIFQQASQGAAAPTAAAAGAPATQGAPGAPGAPGTEEGALVGPVQVEILEGIDMLIIKGDRRDVDQVAQIIQEIEQLSVETKPSIVVHHLLQVDCSAVAEMVNQVYEEVFSARQGSVSITSLVKPNALLLIGRDESVATAVDLIKKLDRPVEPDTQFQVFRLEHLGAETAREMIEEFYDEREGLGAKVVVTTDYRSNALIVQASPRDLKEVGAMLAKLDVDDVRVVNEVRIFKLNNSIADDLQPILENAITGDGGGGGQQQSDEKSIGLRFVTVDTEGQRLLKSGILTDVRITADGNANALVVSAPADSMPLIEALIAELDQLPAVEAQIKVFTIIEGDATNLMEMLEALFGTTTQGRATSQPPVRTGAVEGDSSLVQLRFAVDARTNSIIATGSAGDLNVVEAILLRLDEADVRDRRTTVIRLCNAPAEDVAIAVNEYLSNERQVQEIESEFKSAIELVEQEVVVVAELVSNSLIISATPRYFEEIEALVKQLDERPPMVMIQVLIAEVSLNDADEFGVELGLQDSLLFDRSLLGVLDKVSTTTTQPNGGVTTTTEQVVSATNTPGFLFNSLNPLGNSGSTQALDSASRVGTQGLSNFSLGRMNNELGFGGLVLSASSEAVSVLIRALQEKRRVDILSRPQIMTMDNQSAYIQVGARVPRVTGTSTNEAGQQNQITLENVGLILGVTPRVSPDKMVVMEVDAEKSELGPESEGIPVSISEGQVIRSPQIKTVFAQTTVSATDGQTVVLGGLITTNKSSVNRRVPALASIPILGHLFRYDYTVEKRSELLIILTPHVVTSEEDADLLLQSESERMSWCLVRRFGVAARPCDTLSRG